MTQGPSTDQSDVLAFLATPAAFGAPAGAEVVRMDTHISAIFLCGARALKLKKARVLPYLDFSTVAKREAACRAEDRLNGRTAPMLYKGVRRVTRASGGPLALDGDGDTVDFVVDMARFGQDDLLDRVAARGALSRETMEDLADAIAGFHDGAPVCAQAGGASALQAIIENNAQAFALAPPGTFDAAQVGRVTDGSLTLCARHAARLDRRRAEGRVRRCHGDMHLRNIVLIDGRPTLFDAIEFNDAFSNIDVFYDLSFLLMDLDHRGLRRLANIVMNRYADVTGDADGVPLLGLFLAMRAAIRAHVGGTAIGAAADPGAVAAEARAYLDMAERYLAPSVPRLIAVGGLSGSGKSRFAREAAPFVGNAVGCRVVRTDATRKRLSGVGILDRLPPASYTPEMSAKTYGAVHDEVRALLAAGCPAIADAVFAKEAERGAVEALAREAGVPFRGLWLEAPADVMKARAGARTRNASDADAAVVERQLAYEVGAITWTRLDSSGGKVATVAAGMAALGLEFPSQIPPEGPS